MTWKPIAAYLRIACLLLSAAGFGMAWRLTLLGRSGAEDVPPPFIVMFGLVGFAFLAAALLGRIPLPGDRRP